MRKYDTIYANVHTVRRSNMDDFFNYMENIVTPELLIYMAAALAALIILTMLLRGMRKRRLKGMQAGLESQYNEIKGIPLAFKFNKAVARVLNSFDFLISPSRSHKA